MKHPVIGPRGGISVADVSCDTCVCAASCKPGTRFRDLGCADWVSIKGERPSYEHEKDLSDSIEGKDCTGCGKCADALCPEEKIDEAPPSTE